MRLPASTASRQLHIVGYRAPSAKGIDRRVNDRDRLTLVAAEDCVPIQTIARPSRTVSNPIHIVGYDPGVEPNNCRSAQVSAGDEQEQFADRSGFSPATRSGLATADSFAWNVSMANS
jgi:hypothetical protein